MSRAYALESRTYDTTFLPFEDSADSLCHLCLVAVTEDAFSSHLAWLVVDIPTANTCEAWKRRK